MAQAGRRERATAAGRTAAESAAAGSHSAEELRQGISQIIGDQRRVIAEELRYVKSREDQRNMRSREEQLNQVELALLKRFGWEHL